MFITIRSTFMQISVIRQCIFTILTAYLSVALAFAQDSTKAVRAASGTPLDSNPRERSPYPRLIRIQYGEKKGTILASVSPGDFYESADEGDTFAKISEIPPVASITPKCCGTLFELPRQIGGLKVGTLLYAATFCGGTDKMSAAIAIFTSTDEGKSWAYHSTPLERGSCNSSKDDGLWEPEFEVDASGALVMFWSDETDPCCSQKLAQMRTIDGVTWKHEQNTVASDIQADRPGMAVASRLPDGTYFMTYELCGPAACTVFYRTSPDGWDFGTPSDTGRKIQTTTGKYFEHAPTNHWDGEAAGGDGELLIVGQYLLEPGGTDAPNSGRAIFVNHSRNASGDWEVMPAPVEVDMTPYLGSNNYNNCANYSSALLPVKNGSALLEVATAPTSLSTCAAYFAAEPLGQQ
jgi:hypothetical protein